MNTTRLLKLADDLEASALPPGFTFDMGEIITKRLDADEAIPSCGTAGCMIGFTMLKYLDATPKLGLAGIWHWYDKDDNHMAFSDSAENYYGLTRAQSEALFFLRRTHHPRPSRPCGPSLCRNRQYHMGRRAG